MVEDRARVQEAAAGGGGGETGMPAARGSKAEPEKPPWFLAATVPIGPARKTE